MSLLGEEIVEEWLNRNGCFTIRGIKVSGNNEIDILAIKPKGKPKYRHIECQLSFRSIGYISTGSAKGLGNAELMEQVRKWIEKKFDQRCKHDLRQSLCPGKWTKELVVGNVKHEEEIALFEEAGIVVHRLEGILSEMAMEKTVIKSATGGDLLDLVLMHQAGRRHRFPPEKAI